MNEHHGGRDRPVIYRIRWQGERGYHFARHAPLGIQAPDERLAGIRNIGINANLPSQGIRSRIDARDRALEISFLDSPSHRN